MAQPYIRFFGVDWRSDPKLRMCSPAARGVWIDMITLMMEADPFGYLVINGAAATDQQLAMLTVTPLAVIRRSLQELERNGVYSRRPDGVIFSRRLVRDVEKSEEMRARGRLGGNPALEDKRKVKRKVKRQVNQELKLEDKPHGNNHSHFSDPNGSGRKPPDDRVKALWDRGVAILGESGRSVIGKARREHGDLAVMRAISACETERPSDPLPFFLKALEHRNGGLLPNEGVF